MKPASVSCTRDASAQCHGLPVLHWRGRRTTASGARTASGQGSRQRQQWQASGKCNGGLSSHWGGRRTIASSDEPTGTASGQGSRQRQQWQSSGKCNGGLSSHWGGRRTTASGEKNKDGLEAAQEAHGSTITWRVSRTSRKFYAFRCRSLTTQVGLSTWMG